MTPADTELELLQPWARRAFEDAYRRRPREQASRGDVAYGSVAALRWAHVRSGFHPSRPQLSDLESPAQ
jgi:hypothetical protein